MSSVLFLEITHSETDLVFNEYQHEYQNEYQHEYQHEYLRLQPIDKYY